MKLLITGANGQLGRCLQDRLKRTDHDILALGSKNLDISDFEDTSKKLLAFSPDVVINAAAYTAVDKAESEAAQAYAVNELGAKNLARACHKNQIPLIHISTDYVFDGTSTKPYRETDATNPQSVYGHSKRAGELAIMASGAKYCIIRTAWVFSEHGSNFLKTMLRLAAERDSLSIVSDQYGQPTYAGDLASAIVKLIPVIRKKDFSSEILHYSGSDTCNWYEFASQIIGQARRLGVLEKTIELNPISTQDYPTAAIRPKYSVLDCGVIEQKYGLVPSDWRAALTSVISKITEDQES